MRALVADSVVAACVPSAPGAAEALRQFDKLSPGHKELDPVLGFVFSGKGFIGDLSLEGTKVKKIER